MGKKSSAAPNPHSTLVSLPAGAKEIGIPYSSLREAVLRGDIKHVRLSGKGRYWLKRADLERFIERSTEAGVR